jgi:hypothetical protein
MSTVSNLNELRSFSVNLIYPTIFLIMINNLPRKYLVYKLRRIKVDWKAKSLGKESQVSHTIRAVRPLRTYQSPLRKPTFASGEKRVPCPIGKEKIGLSSQPRY